MVWHMTSFTTPLVRERGGVQPRARLWKNHVMPLVRSFDVLGAFYKCLPTWTEQSSERGYTQIKAGFFIMYQYLNQTHKLQRYVHEVIPSDIPIKIFFDLDASVPNIPAPDTVNILINCFQQFIGVECPVVVLCASNQNKFSKHVVFQYLIRSLDHMRAVADVFKEYLRDQQHGNIAELIDTAVYTKGSTLRVYGSNKRNEMRIFVQDGDPPGAVQQFEPKLFFESLVTCYLTNLQGRPSGNLYDMVPMFDMNEHVFDPDEGIMQRVEYSRNRVDHEPDFRGWKPEAVKVMKDVLMTHIKKQHPRINISIQHFGPFLSGGFHPGLICPNKGTKHKHNRTYFSMQITRKSSDIRRIQSGFMLKFSCSDPACGKQLISTNMLGNLMTLELLNHGFLC